MTDVLCDTTPENMRHNFCFQRDVSLKVVLGVRRLHVYLAVLQISFRRRQWQATPVLLPGKSYGWRSLVGCSPWGRSESDATERLQFHFHFHTMEKAMATHSSVLAWRIPGMAEPDGLPSMGSHRVGHDWCNLAAAAANWYIWNHLESLFII